MTDPDNSADATLPFLRALADALAAGTFVKLTLSKTRQRGDGPQQAFGRPVELKAGPHISFLLRHATKDITVNHPRDQAVAAVQELLASTFANGHLFTTTGDFELRSNKKGVARFSRHPATFTEAPVTTHDRSKRYVLDPAKAPYLGELGITTAEGHIRVIRPINTGRCRTSSRSWTGWWRTPRCGIAPACG